jgi:enoyl-CoA hydratase/carnithine racemase
LKWDISYHNSIAIVSFNNPPDNQMSLSNLRRLDEILQDISRDEDVSLVILASKCPDYFIAHADRNEIMNIRNSKPNDDIFEHWLLTTLRLESISQPVIAAIDGQAWGGGCELALACMLRVGSVSAHFSLIEVSRNAMPGAGGTQRLPRLIGPARAAEMILTSRVVKAQEALSIGLLNAVIDKKNFLEGVLDWSESIAIQPRESLVAAKRALIAAQRLPLAEGLIQERELFLNLVVDNNK